MDAAAVDKIEVDLLGAETRGDLLIDAHRRFVVDAADHDKILGLFRDATADPRPSDWAVRGTISITYKDGQAVSMTLFKTRGQSGAFKKGETYYRGSSDDVFASTLDQCRQRVKMQSDAKSNRTPAQRPE